MGGLYLTSLTLSHFRSHKRAELELDARPVAIHGPNGAGKTNILEAISLLSPGRGLRRAASDELARQPEAVGWKITGQLFSLDRPHELVTWAEHGASRAVQIDSKTAPQTALGRLLRVLWLVPSMDRLWIEGAEGRRRFLDRMTLSFEPSHAEVALTYEKAMRERNRLLKDGVNDPGWYRALEGQMAVAGAQLHANRQVALARLLEAQKVESTFPKADLALVGPDGDGESLSEIELAAVFSENRGRDIAAGRTLKGPHRADLAATYVAKGVPAAQCSTGEQKALLVSLILANARALAEDFGAPPVLLLDEVAAHLDAGRRAALYEELLALGAQAWMTGTGPELFAELGDRARHVLVREGSDQASELVETGL